MQIQKQRNTHARAQRHTHTATCLRPAADGSRRGPGLPPWILCPTAICVRQKIDIFLPKKSIFLSLSMFKSISSSLTVYFCPFFSLFFFHRFFFTHFSLFPLIFFLFFFSLLSSVLCPTLSCVRRQGLPGKARKACQICPWAYVWNFFLSTAATNHSNQQPAYQTECANFCILPKDNPGSKCFSLVFSK